MTICLKQNIRQPLIGQKNLKANSNWTEKPERQPMIGRKKKINKS